MHTISASLLKNMLISASNNLFNHYPEIDALNVFPVPDGDTGMNMNLTLSSGAKEIYNRNDNDVASIMKSFSRGLLMGARGNSGVIISQIFRGFAKSLEGKNEITPWDLADAFNHAKEASYKAVQRPVEGTILTVIRETSEVLMRDGEDNSSIEECFEIVVNEANASLNRTPELLPTLKEAGVVDAGGAGLVAVLEGMQKALLGQFVEKNSDGKALVVEKEKVVQDYVLNLTFHIYKDGSKKDFIEKHFKDFMRHDGYDFSFTPSKNDRMSISIKSIHPGTILAYLQQFGEFENISIVPFNKNAAVTSTPKKKYAIIAVSSGKGIDELFKQIGVDVIVSGGQTMNPSSQDFVEAIKKVNARNIFILPNNSNIVMAASQASEIIEGDYDVRVVPSSTIPQGIIAASMYNEEENEDTNFNNMRAALKQVKSGSVTYAIKDIDIDNIHIVKGYYLGLKNKAIVTCVKEKREALFNLLSTMVDEKSTNLTIIYGEDVKGEEIENLQSELEKSYPQVQISIVDGKQPVYSFLVGVE